MTICKKCGSSDYTKSGNCRLCAKIRHKTWVQENRQRLNLYQQKRREDHKDEINLKHRQWYADNKDILNEKRRSNLEAKNRATEATRKWQRNNPDRSRKNKLRYYYSHIEQHRLYYQQHKKQCINVTRRWQKNHPDNMSEIRRRRRACKKGAIGSISNFEWKELCSHYGNVCLRCGSSDKLTQDHVVPLSKGGFHTIYNLQPLCRSCNSSKRDKTIDYRPDVISLVTKLNC